MASFLRAKQAGVAKDLSGGILPDLFTPEEQARYGINSQISCIAYEPVQSLLAIGTNESQFGSGKIYVFGQSRVQKFFTPQTPRIPGITGGGGGVSGGASIRQLAFVANRLISRDSKSEIAIWNLNTGEQIARHVYAGAVVMVTDPMLDWAFIGTTGQEIFAYDLDRERATHTFRLPNFWKNKDPHAMGMAIVDMQLHPRDIGQLLIGYTHGAVIYSFKQNAPIKYFEYVLPPGAPGGNGEGLVVGGKGDRRPRLTHATWHPTGTFICTCHDDGSMVFWDPRDGRVVAARSLYHTRVNERGKGGQPAVMDPYTKVVWCCKETKPDDTALLIAGGHTTDDPDRGKLTFLDLGPTPIYATSSWDVLTNHFEGKTKKTLEVPPGAAVLDFCLTPRNSPYYNGAQDPLAILATLSSGELITLSFPSGYPISPTNMLHPSLSFVHPFVTSFKVATLDRAQWLGMVEKRRQGELLVKGGAEAGRTMRRYEGRNIIQVAHADSVVRIWDLGHTDLIENPAQLQVDIPRALDRMEDVEITAMDMAEETGEFAAGTRTGEVVIYRWGGNPYFGKEGERKPIPPNPGGLSNIASRSEPTLQEGLEPFVLYEMMQGPVTVVSVSDVGFVAVGSELGFFSIIDLRGPSIIFQGNTVDFVKTDKRSSFLKHKEKETIPEWPTVIEFGVMTLEGDSYSSIACFVGTNLGHVATFKLLPQGQGYTTKPAGVTKMDDKVIAICPIVADTGHAAVATGSVIAGLRAGKMVNGILVAVTQSEIRIFKPATNKGASRSIDNGGVQVISAMVTETGSNLSTETGGTVALVTVLNDRTTKAYSLPGLKEIGSGKLSMLDASKISDAVVARTGDIIGWVGPSEMTVVSTWKATGKGLQNSEDILINTELAIPPRPTISNVQWLSGTQYVSPTDLDLLIGGPDRPPSKRMLAAAAAEERQARGLGPAAGGAGSARAGSSQEGWGDYLTRQLNERTERLNILGDSGDKLQDASAGWAESASKYVNKQKRNMLLGGIKKSFLG
ncbi:lethal giant larvae like, C-terminal-domain-containing protein [Diplogelasinospora grovesii]|uniref:Lethal giant larvae like, C-terminal-domain-containing protein n=1 Tax=Diplogelasinospora grovesii TaxID=303347 RepID=A0AAN6NE00_9PEZI|nr:lethal giant larvae like, C-terminal-domain-containing protein [Diplogelasinospora grovesii]